MKYTNEALAEAAAASVSIAGVLRYLGVAQSGGAHGHVSRRLKHFGIDTSHSPGRPIVAADRVQTSCRKRCSHCGRLALLRVPGFRLRRAMLELGLSYECAVCGVGEFWNMQRLTLHVDHINGNWLDCRLENLRFLCPNCHSQTMTFAGKALRKTGPVDRRHEYESGLAERARERLARICREFRRQATP